MTMRTNTTTVTFANPFTIGDSDKEFPPGDYVVETDEDLIEGLSFPVYRRMSSRLHSPTDPARPGTSSTLVVESAELDLALVRDKKVPVADKMESPS